MQLDETLAKQFVEAGAYLNNGHGGLVVPRAWSAMLGSTGVADLDEFAGEGMVVLWQIIVKGDWYDAKKTHDWVGHNMGQDLSTAGRALPSFPVPKNVADTPCSLHSLTAAPCWSALQRNSSVSRIQG